KLIEPRTLKGFRDYLPELMIPREWMLDQARRVYRSYGFAPIDTPALEYAEILLGKGGEESDKQLYRFQHHSHDIALRFDLTVPFARFAAQYIGQLGTPFKRYHMGPVWRGENTQKGRYREFWQCDFDTIGTTSNAADIEVALVIHDLMRGLGLDRFVIHVNNRLVLNGLLEEIGLTGKTAAVLRALDKIAKVSREEVQAEMAERAGVSGEQSGRLLDFVQTTGTNAEILERLKREFGSNAKASDGIARLDELLAASAKAGIPHGMIVLDLSIARGLDYYTGTVYETFLTDMPKIGSVCSGGRYDNLAGLYTKQSLPGVGASLGLDRLLAALEELKLLHGTATPAPVLVVQFSAERIGDYQRMARNLRAAGIGAEVFPDAKKIGQQFQYAEKRGHKLALIAGPDDFAAGTWNVKDLAKREEKKGVPDADVVALVRTMLAV
ncbi:MAG TPA: histidine--tRNA ligase, partial [Gemmataceae bacterium]|nr:histidine--tRNA ligase [Gemmataceae bacterium]